MLEITVSLGIWGWTVEAGSHIEYVQTGAQAERRARELAEVGAGSGHAVTLQVLDMQGALVASIDYAPRTRQSA